MTEVTIGKRRFPTIKAAAAHYGLNQTTLARRLSAGWHHKDLTNKERRKRATSAAAKPLIYEGISFPSIRALASHLKEQESAVASRIRDRMLDLSSLSDENLNQRRPSTRGKRIKFEGHAFPSVVALCNHYGVTRAAYDRRLQRGYTMREALGLDTKAPSKRFWRETELIDGELLPKTSEGEYKLYKVKNKKNGKLYIGITISPLNVRLSNHLYVAKQGGQAPLHRAIRKYGAKSFSIHLIRSDAANFRELQEQEVAAIKRYGTRNNGYNVAVGGSVGTAKAITVGSMTFASRAAAATHFGITIAAFNLRVSRLGWSPEEAAEISPRRKFSRHSVQVGKLTFKSLAQASKHFGIPHKTVHRRYVTLGWEITRALKTPVTTAASNRGKANQIARRKRKT